MCLSEKPSRCLLSDAKFIRRDLDGPIALPIDTDRGLGPGMPFFEFDMAALLNGRFGVSPAGEGK